MATVPLHDVGEDGWVKKVADDVAVVGVSAVRGALGEAELAGYRELVDAAVEADAALLPAERYDHEYGRVVFLPHYHRRFLDLLERPEVMDPCDELLGPDCVLYTMTTACQPGPGRGRELHVDTSIVVPEGFLAGLGVFVLLDDFTAESGPTRFFPHDQVEAPSAEDFEREALSLEAPAGTVVWFRSRIWHDALPNTTDRWRRLIILALVRPWIRQRFDMARMVPTDPAEMSESVRQKLGFGLLAPGSYEEYYLPPAERQAVLLDRARSS